MKGRQRIKMLNGKGGTEKKTPKKKQQKDSSVIRGKW